MDDLFTDRIRRLSRPFEPRPCEIEAGLSKLSGIQAVFFDIYGTCFMSGSGDIGVSTANPKVEALSESLKEQGVELPEELAEDALARFYELIKLDHEQTRGRGIEFPEIRILDIWEQWRREAQVQVNVSQLAIDVECRLNPVWPMPGLEACLNGLKASGKELGIVSNAQIFTPCLFPALTGRTVSDFGFENKHCVWSWVGKEAKPSVRLYEKILESFPHLSAQDCLYVGNDMRNDIAPAAKVGMKTALFAGDRRSLRLREGDALVGGIKPDWVVTDLLQLLNGLG
ncbi:HAD family hydrolase [Kiritimatiellaeota bacterium B1221]|nr:HAD family hydrolase [Kiritimatiellaeota bacterium B1221]